jgi:alginate O-acetyltransferase complex protein AlgI
MASTWTPRRFLGWSLLVALPALVLLGVPESWPRWAFMWLLAAAIFGGCKALTWSEATVRAPWWLQAGYLAWPGMDAAAFLTRRGEGVRRPPAREWGLAMAKTLVGAGFVWGLARNVPAECALLKGWTGMVGVVLMLHFGSFHLLSCAWRAAGVDAVPLMDRPLASKSVGELWGRRWNRAFRDLTHRFLFRPLSSRLGMRRALWLAFLASGLIHELVVSLPARGGWGGPTAFFLLQALALSFERSDRGQALLGGPLAGRLFTFLVLAFPAVILVHPPFVIRVMVPFFAAIGA